MENREERITLKPDNHDMRLKYYELILESRGLAELPCYPLPEGYRYVYYREGDKKDWIAIETSAREFILPEEGESAWKRYYAGKEKELENRMFFVETTDGEKVATATAFYEPRDLSGAGWLHWVAVKREYQGKGIAKALISHTLQRLKELGYPSVKIPTQTNTWVAARLYLDFGFRPVPPNAVDSQIGYGILKTLTNHPALAGFEPVPYEEIWDSRMVQIEKRLREQYPGLVHFRVLEENGQDRILYCTESGAGEWDSAL